MIRWPRKFWNYDKCVGCRKWTCPKTGPWHSRRRVAAFCPQCMPVLYGPYGKVRDD